MKYEGKEDEEEEEGGEEGGEEENYTKWHNNKIFQNQCSKQKLKRSQL